MTTLELLREVFALQNDERFSQDPGALRSRIRQLLRRRSPSLIVSLFFAQWVDQRPRVILELRKDFHQAKDPARAALSWVFGESPLLDERSHLKPPSRSKRLLQEAILEFAKRKLPWLKGRHLHVMAFRPEYFQSRNRRLPSVSGQPWGPLYRRVHLLQPSGRSRVLHIPNEPLRVVQEAVLRAIESELRAVLPRYVHGLGLPGAETIFKNAEAHRGGRFVVSFDLKRFFPSIRISEIVEGIRQSRASMLTLRPERGVGEPRNRPRLQEVPWARDSLLLVAKLCTFKGRLPQGAPTSPLLASIAFLPFDKRIKQSLGRSVVYTRYFDDITISASRNFAHRRRFASAHQLRTWAEEIICAQLQNSPFHLNDKKTRASNPKDGHRITGLRVSYTTLDLQRKQKRKLRALLHQIQQDGLLSAARKLVGSEIIHNTEPRKNVLDGTSRRYLPPRAVSTERLAVLMLKQLAPDLRWKRKLDDVTGRRLQKGSQEAEGREKWFAIENLISNLWDGRIRVQDRSGGLELTAGNNVIGHLSATRGLDLLKLAPEEAIQCIELWHGARGLSSFYLSAPENTAPSIRRIGEDLAEVLGRTSILQVPSSRIAAGKPTESGPLVIDQWESTRELGFNVAVQLEEFAQKTGMSPGRIPPKDASRCSNVLGDEPESQKAFARFLKAMRQLTTGSLHLVPRETPQSKSHVLSVVQVLAEMEVGDRASDYRIVSQFLERHKLQRLAGKRQWRRAHHAILEEVLELFVNSEKKRIWLADLDLWKNDLSENRYLGEWQERFARSLEGTVRELQLVHAALCGSASQGSVFTHESRERLQRERVGLSSIVDAPSSRNRWEQLFESSLHLNIIFDEGSHLDRKSLKAAVGRKKYEPLNKIRLMRNLRAHAESRNRESRQQRRKEWIQIQKDVAKRLGREQNSRSVGDAGVFLADDLELTALEATEVKLSYLQDLVEMMRVLGSGTTR